MRRLEEDTKSEAAQLRVVEPRRWRNGVAVTTEWGVNASVGVRVSLAIRMPISKLHRLKVLILAK